ncbi:hypothetical protein CLV60_102322 [Dyadobacter jiangsuensis]|uniref:Uncharacterized protein n=1 Tax=Dyadobacter jiangsuensis TaxID=1591085 RepID=A0A2P8GF38_9BACT|nr:hypothetical protein CLV60_102322 [Dyadobacter jiangsuensis]
MPGNVFIDLLYFSGIITVSVMRTPTFYLLLHAYGIQSSCPCIVCYQCFMPDGILAEGMNVWTTHVLCCRIQIA